jgi:predicted transglutaminase-like cysteine proteinase
MILFQHLVGGRGGWFQSQPRWWFWLLGLGVMATAGLAAAPGVILTESAIEQYIEKYGKKAGFRLRRWQALMRENQELTDIEKLELVNSFFNQVHYKTDKTHWKKKDYWATPQEMLNTFGGDCEDYAIAKYLTLRQLGVPEEKLRITYVKYRKRGTRYEEAHMVLSYYENLRREPYILDNINKQMLKASQRPDLIPVYSFNGEGLWVAKGGGGGQLAGSSSRLDRWNSLKSKLAEEASH